MDVYIFVIKMYMYRCYLCALPALILKLQHLSHRIYLWVSQNSWNKQGVFSVNTA